MLKEKKEKKKKNEFFFLTFYQWRSRLCAEKRGGLSKKKIKPGELRKREGAKIFPLNVLVERKRENKRHTLSISVCIMIMIIIIMIIVKRCDAFSSEPDGERN